MSRIPGKFVWFEIMTQEPEKAKAFYSEVIGWKPETVPMPAGDYTMFGTRKRPVAGIFESPKGMPAHWTSYLSVDDVDRAVTEAKAAGGAAIAEAIDIPEVGRMQRIADPTGGQYNVFAGSQEDPADEPSWTGCFHWNELWTSDPEAAVKFYETVHGYSTDAMDMPNIGKYHSFSIGGQPRAGVMKSPVPNAPATWVPYIAVNDLDAAIERATKLDGKAQGPVVNVENVGRFGVVQDPEGAVFGMIKPASS